MQESTHTCGKSQGDGGALGVNCRKKSQVTFEMGGGFLQGKGRTAKKAGLGVGVLIHTVSGDNEKGLK